MTRLQETIVVPRSVSDSFRYIADFSTIEQWDPGVYRSRKTSPGAVREGSEFHLILSSGGRKIEMTYVLEEIIPGRRLVLTGSSKQVQARDVISFRALDASHTEIEYQADLTFSGVLGAAEGLLGPWLKRIGVQAVEGMQQALTPQDRVEPLTMGEKIKEKAVLPAAWEFTERGYLSMKDKGLSEFVDEQTIVLTGPTGGLGLAAAKELSRLGARLILVGRTPQKLSRAIDQIRDFSGCDEDKLDVVEADLSILSEVRRAAEEIRGLADGVGVLINNAGALFHERRETAEGLERTVALNLVAPFVLTEELMDLLERAGGRVINVASGGMYTQALYLDDMNYEQESFDGAKAYARAKRGLVALTEYWAEEHEGSGMTFNSMHPGWANTPGVKNSLPLFHSTLQSKLRDPRMGADTTVWLAASSAVEQESGSFFFDRKPRPTAIFPGTEVRKDKRDKLLDWLRKY